MNPLDPLFDLLRVAVVGYVLAFFAAALRYSFYAKRKIGPFEIITILWSGELK